MKPPADDTRTAGAWMAGLLLSLSIVLLLPAPDAAKGISGYVPPACDSGICGGFGGDHGVGISGVTQIFRINVRALVLGCAFVGVALLEMRHTLSFREPLQNPAAGMAGVSVCWHSLIL